MFNQEESAKLWKCVGKGAATGGIICGILFVYSIFAGMWNCLCDMFGSCDGLPKVNSFLTYLFVFLISVVIGLIVGLAQAGSDRAERLRQEEFNQSQAAKAQREKYAADIKIKLQNAVERAQSIKNTALKIKETPSLVGLKKQQAGWEALNTALNKNEEVKRIVEDIQCGEEG